MAYVHKKFPDGHYYQIDEEAPEVRLCCGMGGTCRTGLSPTWHHPLCPACKLQRNLFLMFDRPAEAAAMEQAS